MNPNAQPNVVPKILVIDDERAILMTLEHILHAGGYEAELATSGREGLAMFHQGKFDLVTVDRAMPDMGGEEVAAEIKRIAPEMPVFLITGFPGAVHRKELFRAIFGKPFRSAELLESIATALARAEKNEPDLPAKWMAGVNH